MKAYQIKLEIIDSKPLIWRRVIMPADATFRRLHDVIQRTLNFQDYHLYEFDLSKDNMIVTDNEEAYEEHKYFIKNRTKFEKNLKNMPPEFIEFEKARQDYLQKEIRKPTGIKIDKYLEEYNELHYTYDFGDNWQIFITLESITNDYLYGYPTLVDGEGTAPPENVGGFMGFQEFLQIVNNPKHPDYNETKAWAEEVYYSEFDPEFINSMLKYVKYKKTEWDKINGK